MQYLSCRQDFLYKKKKSKKSACGGAVLGAILMALVVWYRTILSFIRYIITMRHDTILAAYQAIFPGVKSIFAKSDRLNMPFTFVKAMISVVINIFWYTIIWYRS